jgi:nitrogenase subunit NifH
MFTPFMFLRLFPIFITCTVFHKFLKGNVSFTLKVDCVVHDLSVCGGLSIPFNHDYQDSVLFV